MQICISYKFPNNRGWVRYRKEESYPILKIIIQREKSISISESFLSELVNRSLQTHAQRKKEKKKPTQSLDQHNRLKMPQGI